MSLAVTPLPGMSQMAMPSLVPAHQQAMGGGSGSLSRIRARRNIDAGLHRAYASHPGFLEGEPQQSGRSGQFRGE
jgi:hypothetical protein